MTLIPFDDRDGQIWMDGAMVPWREARLHVLSHGLHYASGVFEGERSYAGNIFKLREHTERLIRSAAILGFVIPYTAEEIDAACNQVVAANGLTDAYVRPLAWRGAEQLSVSAQQTRIHLAIASWAWPNLFGDEPDAGRAAGHGAVEAAASGNGADGQQGGRAVHDRHAVQARGGGGGLRRRADAGLARPGGGGDGGQPVPGGRRGAAHAGAGLLPGRHHAPDGDEPGAPQPDEGGRAGRSCRRS